MTKYLVRHAAGQRGDFLIEDDDLVLGFSGTWAIFRDGRGISFAVPAEHVADIQRLDADRPEPDDTPASVRKDSAPTAEGA